MEELLLVKIFIVYDTRYGNTKRVAETIVEGINEIGRVEAVLKEPDQIEPEEVLDYDLILIGSPNHYGGPTRGIREFIDGLEEIGLEGKVGAVFDTYLGAGFFEKAAKRMEKRINEKAPGLKLIVPGLSVRVEKSRGPIAEGELPKCRDFGKKIVNQLKICARF
ncbi:MAG: flavodoxin family protein [Candidatus Bathyarchaeia archaeon]